MRQYETEEPGYSLRSTGIWARLLGVEKLVDVVGLHLNPPEGAVVLSVDEKSR
ncbi:hypothetical protein ACIQ6K_39935 [Streptomyces sp. NPDC096354]|uniref:hypothetical protein n=1 Tax=Streptomyces sp. NPDC096354 TaxID=3366088 RepID=UPI0037FAADE2